MKRHSVFVFIRACMMIPILVTFSVTSQGQNTCYEYLKLSVNEKYSVYEGPRVFAKNLQNQNIPTEVSVFNLEPYPYPLDVNHTGNRVAIRSLLSDALNPIFIEISRSVPTDRVSILSWAKEYRDLLESLIFSPIGPNTLGATRSFKVYNHLFNFVQPLKAEIYSLWTDTDPVTFQFGVDPRQSDFFRKLLASSYYIIFNLNRPQIVNSFHRNFSKSDSVFFYHTYTSEKFRKLMDFTFLSYFQALSLLNVRPAEGPYPSMTQMTQAEWLGQLLLPQSGQKISLIEILSLSLKPSILGLSGINYRGLKEPLIYSEGRLKFSPTLMNLIKESAKIKADEKLAVFETSLGCPAAYCASGQTETSMRLMSQLLLDVFSEFDKIKLPGTGFYDPKKEPVYFHGHELLEQFANSRF
jgi:hypothetical protein